MKVVLMATLIQTRFDVGTESAELQREPNRSQFELKSKCHDLR